jgi:hypothetical protein
MEECPPDMAGRCEDIEEADKRWSSGEVLTTTHREKK